MSGCANVRYPIIYSRRGQNGFWNCASGIALLAFGMFATKSVWAWKIKGMLRLQIAGRRRPLLLVHQRILIDGRRLFLHSFAGRFNEPLGSEIDNGSIGQVLRRDFWRHRFTGYMNKSSDHGRMQ